MERALLEEVGLDVLVPEEAASQDAARQETPPDENDSALTLSTPAATSDILSIVHARQSLLQMEKALRVG